jgi:hypothetical protein
VTLASRSVAHAGRLSARLVSDLTQAYPALRPLVLVLKQLVHGKRLSNPYTGGLGSYALVLMVASLLQQRRAALEGGGAAAAWREAHRSALAAVHAHLPHPVAGGRVFAPRGRRRPRAETPVEARDPREARDPAAGERGASEFCLGALLMEFLQVYGHDFRPSTDFVAVQPVGPTPSPASLAPGSVLDGRAALPFRVERSGEGGAAQGLKAHGGAAARPRPGGVLARPELVIADPADPTNNAGRSCFRFRQVQHAFTQALMSLLLALRSGVQARPLLREFLKAEGIQKDRDPGPDEILPK